MIHWTKQQEIVRDTKTICKVKLEDLSRKDSTVAGKVRVGQVTCPECSAKLDKLFNTIWRD